MSGLQALRGVSTSPALIRQTWLPYQRPAEQCRTFRSAAVERVIGNITSRMEDPDLARLFENAFPNTLDTTIRWHTDGEGEQSHLELRTLHRAPRTEWKGSHTFVVTGDINAEWLRDSTNQLLQYQSLSMTDPELGTLILGAINTETEFIIESPYCNSFQPPPPANLPTASNNQDDRVSPMYDPNAIFECKYELDSLAAYLSLANEFYANTKSRDFLTTRFYTAIDTLLTVLDEQSESTFDPDTGAFVRNTYTFQRSTTSGTETLSLKGIGNPLNYGTGLIRSAFRPSDDATVFGFLIPANAMMAVELKRTAAMLTAVGGKENIAKALRRRGEELENAVWESGVVETKQWGKVFAYEVDGYGGQLLMDDANVPSLLSLPRLGFVSMDNEVYRNTRRMILSRSGNPYYMSGKAFEGIGGPHIGPQYAWPMSRLVQALTSSDDTEIRTCLDAVLKTARLGLIHESINVNHDFDYTRHWFAWANSVFAQTILDLAERKPHLIFGKDALPYRAGEDG